MAFESDRPTYQNHLTERELDYAFSVQKAVLLKKQLPPPKPITTGLAAEFITEKYKSDFG